MSANLETRSRESAFSQWIDAKAREVAELAYSVATCFWRATGSGDKADYEASAEAELLLMRLFSRRDDFAYLKELRESGAISEPLLKRQLEVLYLGYLGNQFDPDLMERVVKLSSALEARFNTFRPAVDGKIYSDNEIDALLRSSTDSALRRRLWEASKEIGAVVAEDLIKLVKLRNQAARELGYDDYYVMSLQINELDETRLFELVDEMAEQTRASFRELKRELDETLAQRYGIASHALAPWHYEDRFFQETPSVGVVDLDAFYSDKDTTELAALFYDSMGMPARDVIARSDLKGREGKYQHAYCLDLDRQGDVRVMASVEGSTYWMDTQLHEFGHAVYSVGHDSSPTLPYFLKSSAHILTTEGVANLMGRLAHNPFWMARFAGMDRAEAERLAPLLLRRARLGALVFAQWCQVMTHFERDLYRDPDQDLNSLWWHYVHKYQMLTPPKGRNTPDWASKIHLVSSPVYYQNYLLGELYQAQLHASLVREFFPGQDSHRVIYADSEEVGRYLFEKVFRPGARWRWEEFVERSTGEPLSTRAFAQAYIE